MSQLLTDRNFWVNFWESKTDLIFEIQPDYVFGKELRQVVQENGYQSAIELGGFPGYYSVYLRKYLQLETSLFDYFIHQKITGQLLETNGLKKDDIRIIEADLFQFEGKEKFDLVCSFGLIEHFKDTEDIFRRHLQFLKPGGTLFITLPNFRGVNGWVQKTFDRLNYDKHEIACMDPDLLKKIAENLGLDVRTSTYFGGFSVWLENRSQKSLAVRAFVKSIWIAGKIFSKLVPFQSRLLSPYILIAAKSS